MAGCCTGRSELQIRRSSMHDRGERSGTSVLGYYRLLAAGGPMTPATLAERSGTGEHYAREWLNAQAAGADVTYDPTTGSYTLPPRAGRRTGRREQPGLPTGLLPDRPRHRPRCPADPRSRPHRRRARLARAQRRRAHRVRALLPARPPGQPGVRVAARARRRRRPAPQRGTGRRRGMRPRGLDRPHGGCVPGLDVPRLRLPRWVDRHGPASDSAGWQGRRGSFDPDLGDELCVVGADPIRPVVTQLPVDEVVVEIPQVRHLADALRGCGRRTPG